MNEKKDYISRAKHERIVQELEAIIIALQKENKELKERIAQLEKNSSNSSKPPSSDIVKPKKDRKKRKRRKKRTSQGGHRKLLPAEEIDKVENLILETELCPECSSKLNKDMKKGKIQQVAELVEKPVEITEYRLEGYWCPRCRKYHYPKLPNGIIEGSFCQVRLRALLIYLKGTLGMSYTGIVDYCRDVLKLKLSRAMIGDILKGSLKPLRPIYDELKEYMRTLQVLYIDESGWKDNANRYWLWVFCTELVSLFTIATSRSSKVLEEVLGEFFDGIIVSDFFSAYFKYAAEKNQFCLAHLIRDIKYLQTLPSEEEKEFGDRLLRYFKRLFKIWHDRENLEPDKFAAKMQRLKNELFNYLNKVNFDKSKSRTLKNRLLKNWESLFLFVDRPDDVEPTNNLSERTLRFLVLIRKMTQGTRSAWGREWVAILASIKSTLNKQNRNTWEFLVEALSAYYSNSKLPSLLPELA